MRPEEDVRRDVRALWVAVFGELPALEEDPATMLAILVEHLPAASYATLMRDGVISPFQAPPEAASVAEAA
jgi:hypothetical protein